MDSRVLVLAIIFSSLLSHFPSQIQASQNQATNLVVLQKVCSGSSDAKSCLKTFQSDLNAQSFTSLKAASEVSLASTRKLAAEIRDFFKAKAKSSPNAALKECASYFDEAIGELDLRGLDDGTASLDIHYAYDSVTSCQTALSNAKIKNPLITAKIEEWMKIYTVASSAVNAAENA